jgi:hypothetical protein
MIAEMFRLQKSTPTGKNSAMAAQKFAAQGLEEAELRHRLLAMWRLENLFRLARELQDKDANNLFTSL